MTLPDRATVQALARPQFAQMLQRQGRPVIITRPGQPDVTSAALLLPTTSQSRQGTRVTDPSVVTLPWKVFFRHDEDSVRDAGFTLTFPPAQGQPGITLTPGTPTVDVADQGVALMSLCTPLTERTRVHDLVFGVPGTGMVRDSLGNLVPAPGGTLAVQARLSATTDPKLRDTVGADNADLVLIGRWGSLTAPSGRPDGVRWGSQSPLVIDGQAGALTVQLAYPDEDTATEAQFGQRFLALWRTP